MIDDDLLVSELQRFGDWPSTSVPKGPPGVYTIWNGEWFLYVGISWKEPSMTSTGTSRGLWGRLDSHASGRRSGDQFCVYVCDRFVLPGLEAAEIQQIAVGKLSLDQLTKAYIKDHLGYRFVNTTSGAEARKIEAAVRRGGLGQFGKPHLNPL